VKIKKFKKIVYEEHEIDIDNILKTISHNIRKLRKDRNLNQEEFAEVLNLSRPTIVNIESCRQMLTIKNLIIICSSFDVETVDILGF
jgi:transcriptional regulator with XRE-family HTH domain